jgi:ABC-type transport system involved in multi-copper enzyme maturation permease subunit
VIRRTIIVGKYIGAALGLALVYMVVTGMKMLLGSGGKRS